MPWTFSNNLVIPIQTFACNACGFVNKEFLPDMDRDDSDEEKT